MSTQASAAETSQHLSGCDSLQSTIHMEEGTFTNQRKCPATLPVEVTFKLELKEKDTHVMFMSGKWECLKVSSAKKAFR